jgi:hypothetical protein
MRFWAAQAAAQRAIETDFTAGGGEQRPKPSSSSGPRSTASARPAGRSPSKVRAGARISSGSRRSRLERGLRLAGLQRKAHTVPSLAEAMNGDA